MPSVPDSSEFTKYRKYRAAAADYANGFAFNRRRVTYVPSPPLGAYAGFIRDSEIALSVGPAAPAPAPAPPTDPPVAEFSADPLSGSAGVTLISFTDESTNNPTSWLWDFGDGNTSTLQNPTHTYAVANKYTVTLTATNAAGSDGNEKIEYITITSTATTIGADFDGAVPTSNGGYYEVTLPSIPPPVEMTGTQLDINFTNIPTSADGGAVTLDRVSVLELRSIAAAVDVSSVAGLPEGYSYAVTLAEEPPNTVLFTFTPAIPIEVFTDADITFDAAKTISSLKLRLLAAPPLRSYNFTEAPVSEIPFGDGYYQAGPADISSVFTGTVVELDFIGIPTTTGGESPVALTQVQYIEFVAVAYAGGRTVTASGLSGGVTASLSNNGSGFTLLSFSSKVPISELEATKLNLTFSIGITLQGAALLRLYPA